LQAAPKVIGARFQLRLLPLHQRSNFFEVQSVWQAFDELDERHPLRLFKTGMLHLAKDEFEDCVALLEQGISLCDTASINKDMRRVIEKVRAVVPAKPLATTQPATQNKQQLVMLARYGQTRDDKSKA